MNKKKFVINKNSYTIVIGHRNYLEYLETHRNTSLLIRRRISKGLSSANTIDELEALARPLIDKIESEIAQGPKAISKLHEYLKENEYRYKPRTYKQFEGVCTRFVSWCKIEKIKPHYINFEQTKKYISFVALDRNKNTVANIILVLKTVFNGLIKSNHVSINHFANLPKIKRAPVSLMYFNDLQIKAIVSDCEANNKQLLLAIELLYTCFVRPAEMRLLQLYDLNLQDGFIEIKGEISKNGKTQKVILSESLKEKLNTLQNNYPLSYYLFSKNGTPGENPVSTNYFNHAHLLMLKRLKIRGRYALYSWKHTGVVKMVKAGIHIKEIQLQLRHHSLDMVNEYLKDLGVMDSNDLKNKMPLL